jgi:hypothetical protein
VNILTIGIGELPRTVSRAVFELGHDSESIYWGESGEYVDNHTYTDYDGVLINIRTKADLAKAQSIIQSLEIPPEKYAYFASCFAPVASGMSKTGICFLNILGKLREQLGKLNYLTAEKKRQWLAGPAIDSFPAVSDLRWPVVGDPAVLDSLPKSVRKSYASGNFATRLGESCGYVGIDLNEKLTEIYKSLQVGTFVWLLPEEAEMLGASFQIIYPVEIEAFSNQYAQSIQHSQVGSLNGKVPFGGTFEKDVECLLSKFELKKTAKRTRKRKQSV